LCSYPDAKKILAGSTHSYVAGRFRKCHVYGYYTYGTSSVYPPLQNEACECESVRLVMTCISASALGVCLHSVNMCRLGQDGRLSTISCGVTRERHSIDRLLSGRADACYR